MGNTQRSRDQIVRQVASYAVNELLEKSQVKLVAWIRVQICAECPISDECEKPCSKALKFAEANRGSVLRALAVWN